MMQGPAKQVLASPDSPTAKWIRELDAVKKDSKKKSRGAGIEVQDFALYDMAPVSAKFPVGKFSVITGESGSGKSTLLFEGIARRAHAGEFAKLGI